MRSMQTDTDAVINMAVKCTTSQVIYCITCKKERYREQDCEKTVMECRSRIHQHRVSVTGTDGKTGPKMEKVVGANLNGPGHKASDTSQQC